VGDGQAGGNYLGQGGRLALLSSGEGLSLRIITQAKLGGCFLVGGAYFLFIMVIYLWLIGCLLAT